MQLACLRLQLLAVAELNEHQSSQKLLRKRLHTFQQTDTLLAYRESMDKNYFCESSLYDKFITNL